MSQVLYEFTIGVNGLMIYAVVTAMIVIVMSLFSYRRGGYDGLEISPLVTERTVIYVIVVMTTLFYVALVTSVVDNSRPLGYVVMVLLVVIFGIALYLISYLVKLIKIGWLHERIEQIRLQKVNIERARAIKLQRLKEEQDERYRREAKRNAERKKRQQ